MNADQFAKKLRMGTLSVVPRIHDGDVLIDLRSVFAAQDAAVIRAVTQIDGPTAGC